MFTKATSTGITLFLVFIFLPSFLCAKAVDVADPPVLNTINGQVWDPNNRPVPDIYVELLNEVNSTLDRQKTSSSGLFTFRNVSAGRFRLHVLSLGTNYLEQTQDVQILNLVQGMSDNQYVEFRLRYDPRRINIGSGGAAEDIFVQEGLPQSAEKHYTKGKELLLDKKSKEAMDEFALALQAFPNYYHALNALGRELVEQKRYRDSLEPLIKAIDINQRSFSSFYALAYACYQLNEIPQAIEAAKATTILKPGSLNAQLLYGTVLRVSGDYTQALASLQKAKSIDNKIGSVNWQLALVYNRLKRNKEAADELELYLKNQPNASDKNEVRELIVKLRSSGAVDIK